MRLVRPRSEPSVRRLLAQLAQASVTYDEVGGTLSATLPAGYHHQRAEAVVGQGRSAFDRSVGGLHVWAAHRVVGVRVLPADVVIESGSIVLVAVGTPWLAAVAPCRIVAVLDEPDRWGFAYGTLPGHPESGEESFVVSVTPDGNVKFTVTAFSRPASMLTSLAGPLATLVQRRATASYLRALSQYVLLD